MSKKDNFKGKDNSNGFAENKNNINKNGRPRKSFATINEELKKKGITKLSKSDLLDAYALIFNSTEDDLKDIAKDKNTPYALKLIILELNDKKTRAKAMQDYRDYSFGRATDNVDHTTAGKEFKIINLGIGTNPDLRNDED